MSSIFASPEAAAGTNVPDYAAEEESRLKIEYENLEQDVVSLLSDARKLPATVETEEQAAEYTAIISRFTDVASRINGIRESEKLPHLRRGTAVDSFFFGKIERLLRRKKTDKPGGGDVLADRLHAYNMKRLAEERRQREEAERLAIEEEQRIKAAREKLEQEQRDAEQRAARARKDENVAAAQAEAKAAQDKAAELDAQEDIARANRQAAQEAAAAKPADMVRERHGSALNTMELVWQVTIEDEMKLDSVKLWPFVSADAKEKAANAWAKTTQHRQQMDGLKIEQVPKTRVRR